MPVVEKHLKDSITRSINDDSLSPSTILITSVKIDIRSAGHDVVHVYARGGLAGQLVVNKDDALEIARRLLPDG